MPTSEAILSWAARTSSRQISGAPTYNRAGWYSYDFLDNGRRPSATTIVKELQPVVTWAFMLERGRSDSTRLIVRVRAARGYRFRGLPVWVSRPLIRIVHFVMQRKQLLEIARRAEPASAGRREAA